VGLGALADGVLEYVFNARASASFAKGSPLMSFFALFQTVTAVVSLAMQSALTRPLLERLGLGGTLSISPGLMALGGALVLGLPRLWTTAVLRSSEVAMRHSLFRPAYELLYTPLPREQKRASKVIVDVGMDRLGAFAGAVVVMLVLFLVPGAPTRVLLALFVVLSVLSLALAPRLQRGYVRALAENLRSGALALDDEEVIDATTRTTLAAWGRHAIAPPPPPVLAEPATEAITELCSGDPQRIGGVLHKKEPFDPRLAPYVIPLLARDDVFAAAVAVLRGVALSCTGQLVDALLDPTLDPVVRRRVPRVLKAAPTQRAVDGLLLGLDEQRFEIRYRCAEALVWLHGQNPGLEMPREQILAAALRDLKIVPPGGRGLDHVFSILSLTFEREPLVTALRALRAGDEDLRGTALEYLDNVLPEPIRVGLWPLVGSPERVAPSGRSTEQIRDDLLRSTRSRTLARVTAAKRLRER
ncbi:MAG TPA: Npt1/Npt2 family nucleotide transporter, partial [Vicinamibacteria bacterium]|nr:Npt1/Npt2 family nucleotide transporter [Vicinamibacteria bacterium]